MDNAVVSGRVVRDAWPGEYAEAESFADMYAAAVAHAGRPLARVQRFGHVVARAIPDLSRVKLLNAVSNAGTVDDDVEWRHVLDASAWLTEVGVRHQIGALGGSCIEQRLLDEGWVQGYAWRRFSVELAGWREPELQLAGGLDVREVEAHEAERFGAAFADGYEMPPLGEHFAAGIVGRDGWTAFAAFDGDEIAGVGAVRIDGGVIDHMDGPDGDDDVEPGGVAPHAWLGMGATRMAWRRQGIQQALLVARLSHARSLGATWAFTETGDRVDGQPWVSYDNILRAGMVEDYLRPNLVHADV